MTGYRMTPRGRQRLTDREGKRLVAYPDPGTGGEPWTIGVGHTGLLLDGTRVRRGARITAEQCDELLMQDLRKFEAALNKALKVPVADHEFDALLSIMFNVGEGFAKSTAIRKLNAGDRPGAAKAIMMWNKPAIIVGRRTTEQSQFLTPYPKAAS